MISEDRMLKRMRQLKTVVGSKYDRGSYLHDQLIEAIDLIPLGWQAANKQEDSRVSVALESDDND